MEEFIIAIATPTIIFGGIAIIAIPFERFFKTKKGEKILMALYKAIKDGKI